MTKPAERSRLAIIDDNRMRQAGMVSLLSDWAREHELEIKRISASSVLAEFGGGATYRLVLFSVGGGTIRSGETDGLIRVLHALAPHAPVVVISDRDDPEEIVSAYRASCSGYIPTGMDPELALQALGFILGGGSYFPPSALRLATARSDAPSGGGENIDGAKNGGSISHDADGKNSLAPHSDEDVPDGFNAVDSANGAAHQEQSDSAPLTGRQHDVLQCLQRGHPNKLIARELGLTEGTVKVHVRQIMRKLGATNRTQVAVLSARETIKVTRVQVRRKGVGIQ